jgi:chromosome segregation ATPase
MFDLIGKLVQKKERSPIESIVKNTENTIVEEDQSFIISKYREKISIVENRNYVLKNKLSLLEETCRVLENKYNSLLKASKEEINRIIDARKLLSSDSKYQEDLKQLGLVSKATHENLINKYYSLEVNYQDLKDDYDKLSRKLNNILSENI